MWKEWRVFAALSQRPRIFKRTSFSRGCGPSAERPGPPGAQSLWTRDSPVHWPPQRQPAPCERAGACVRARGREWKLDGGEQRPVGSITRALAIEWPWVFQAFLPSCSFPTLGHVCITGGSSERQIPGPHLQGFWCSKIGPRNVHLTRFPSASGTQ